MPPAAPTDYIRTLKFTLRWSAAIAGATGEVRHVCDALQAARVRIEREIEDCIDDGLRGKQLEDPNTRVRMEVSTDALQLELSVQITFASLVAETVEQVMVAARKVDECASAVLRSHTTRLDARVVEQQRQVRLVRMPAKVVPVKAEKPAPAASSSSSSANAPSPAIIVWLIVNTFISLLALIGVFILLLLRQR
jgi:hypothetical protein